jgi:gag-polypeptide of LTR copia-type
VATAPNIVHISTLRSDQPIQFIHYSNPYNPQFRQFILSGNHIFLPVLRCFDLIGFIDGSRSPPTRVISVNGVNSTNPEFTCWHQQNKLILVWIFSSISELILAQVLNAETSFQLWQQLSQSHTSQSIAKVLELKFSLQTSKKGGSTCAQFIQHIQSLADRLRNIEISESDQDMILYTLQRLSSDYDSFVTALSMRQTSAIMLELQSLLLAHEVRVQANLKSSATPSAHLTSSFFPSSCSFYFWPYF